MNSDGRPGNGLGWAALALIALGQSFPANAQPAAQPAAEKKEPAKTEGPEAARGKNEEAVPESFLALDTRKIERGNRLRVSGTAVAAFKKGTARLLIGVPPVRISPTDCGPKEAGVCFVVPYAGREAPRLGLQRVRLEYRLEKEPGELQSPSLGSLEVSRQSTVAFEVDAIGPSTTYPEDHRYSLVVTGRGFGDTAKDHALYIDGRQVPVCWLDDPKGACEPTVDGSTGEVTSPQVRGLLVSPRELRLSELPDEYAGSHEVRLRLGDGDFSAPKTVTFSFLSRSHPSLYAALGTAAVFALLLLLIRTGSKEMSTSEGEPLGRLQALLVDKDSETYSLTRLQFYAWTFAGVFAYCFLAVAKALVQGRPELPDVPGNLPGILAISAGTSITSMGIDAVRGPKGPGPMKPSFRDLLSTGGVVAPERVQLLIWTVVSVLVFLIAVFRSDPAVAQSAPSIPEGLLYLSGVSAFGFLGGKMTRKPGPVIDSVVAKVDKDGPTLTIEAAGRNLASDGTATIAGKDLSQLGPDSLKPEVTPGADGQRVQLRIVLEGPDLTGLPLDKLPLSFKNPDGQLAETKVPLTSDDLKALVPAAAQGPANDPGSTSPPKPGPA